jgi:hypothetical protein
LPIEPSCASTLNPSIERLQRPAHENIHQPHHDDSSEAESDGFHPRQELPSLPVWERNPVTGERCGRVAVLRRFTSRPQQWLIPTGPRPFGRPAERV